MAKVNGLTRAFLEAHPAEAARVLEHVPPANCAALLNSISGQLAIDILKHLLPAHAARCLENLKPRLVIVLLRRFAPQAGADLLRHLPDEARERLLAQLPAGIALTLRLLLSYPDDTVGAWIDSRAPALPPDATVKEALERLRRAHHDLGDYFYVVNIDQRLQGIARLADVVRVPNKTPIAEVMKQPAPTLSARAPLSAAQDHPAWRDFHALAVVDHHGRFIGALPYGALVRACAQQSSTSTPQLVGDTLNTVVNTYWFGVASVIRAAISFFNVRNRHEH
ncbi:MAG: magnesium transporter [Gammaproteobacteria bacterium]|nr:magnesium transporter [Gammaproteobacteria bacterium]